MRTAARALAPRKADRAPEPDGLQLASSFATKLAPLAGLFAAAALYLELAVKQPLVAQMQAQAQILQTIVAKLDEVPRLAGISERLNKDFDVLLGKQVK